jgi:hypothetical protein
MADKQPQTWDIWYPKAAATGLPFARGKLDKTNVLWVHAAPDVLTVSVREDERVVAIGKDLTRSGDELPTTRLWIEGDEVRREDRWPTPDDLGSLIILPGGEVGTLLEWWNAEDGSEWRWRVEIYNHR